MGGLQGFMIFYVIRLASDELAYTLIGLNPF